MVVIILKPRSSALLYPKAAAATTAATTGDDVDAVMVSVTECVLVPAGDLCLFPCLMNTDVVHF